MKKRKELAYENLKWLIKEGKATDGRRTCRYSHFLKAVTVRKVHIVKVFEVVQSLRLGEKSHIDSL